MDEVTPLPDVISELRAPCGDEEEENGDRLRTASSSGLRTCCIPAASVLYALPLLLLLRVPGPDAVVLAELARLAAMRVALAAMAPPKSLLSGDNARLG